MTAVLRRPVLGTALTWGGAVSILAVAPAFWAVFDLVLVVIPS